MSAELTRTRTKYQYALNAYLVKKYESSAPVGKKAIQKLVFFCNELAYVPTGYRFTLYTFGPFSRDLAADIDIFGNLGVLAIRYDELIDSFLIRPGSKCDRYIKDGDDFLKPHRRRINRVLRSFADRTAKDLELSATLLYLLKHQSSHQVDKKWIVINQYL